MQITFPYIIMIILHLSPAKIASRRIMTLDGGNESRNNKHHKKHVTIFGFHPDINETNDTSGTTCKDVDRYVRTHDNFGEDHFFHPRIEIEKGGELVGFDKNDLERLAKIFGAASEEDGEGHYHDITGIKNNNNNEDNYYIYNVPKKHFGSIDKVKSLVNADDYYKDFLHDGNKLQYDDIKFINGRFFNTKTGDIYDSNGDIIDNDPAYVTKVNEEMKTYIGSNVDGYQRSRISLKNDKTNGNAEKKIVIAEKITDTVDNILDLISNNGNGNVPKQKVPKQ